MQSMLLSAESSSFFNKAFTAIGDFGIKYGIKLVAALLVLVIGLWLVKALVKATMKSKWFARTDRDVKGFAKSGIKAALSLLVIVTAIAIMGVPMASIIAVIASFGVVIGLALQGSLSNLAGGLMILIFKPFHVGDHVITDKYEGIVEEIGLFYTSVTTFDNRCVRLPNASLSNSDLINATRYTTRRVDIVFPVDASADMDKVVAVLNDMANGLDNVIKDKPIFVRFDSFGDGCAKYAVRVWCETKNYWTVYYDMLEHGKRELAMNGIKVPLPQMEVHTRSEQD